MCVKDGIKLYRIREGLPALNDTSIDYVIRKNQSDFPIVIKEILYKIVGNNIDINIERDAIAIENLREFTEKENSILVSNPQIASEWNYEKNGKVKPEYFSENSNKKVWWKCDKAHEWYARIADRNNGDGCPYCAGRYVTKGKNDLRTVTPNLAKEWNFEKNGELIPENCMPNSSKIVWWKCDKGHEWQTSVKHRNNGSGCPYCNGRNAIKGETDLQTVNHGLSKEWNYEKNGGLTPMEIKPSSGKKVWWICDKGHEWQARIADRNKGNGCPYCSGRYVVNGENDLQTVNPILANEWNFEKNDGVTPVDVLPNSNKKVWWKCSKGHEWQAVIKSRNKGSGCPECAKVKRKCKNNSNNTI